MLKTLTVLILLAAAALTEAWRDQRSARAESSRLQQLLARNDEGMLRSTFAQWAQQHGRSYAASEQEARFAQYRRGLEAIVRINQRAGGTFWAAPNAFTDLSFEEFAARNLGAVVPPGMSPDTPAPKQQRGRKLLDSAAAPPPPPPKYVNWVEKGKVTPVKTQGGCGACWSFAATAAIESKYLIQRHYNWTALSNQHMVDCVNEDSGYGSRGCAGGWPTDVLDYAHRANISREEAYPYTGKTGTCNSEALARTTQDSVARVSKSQGYLRVPSKDNTAFMRAVAKQPAIVAFNVENSFQYYAGGVYQASQCGNTTINHALLVVGYDATPGVGSESAYYLIKNSWGTKWGEAGYARVQMADTPAGACGLLYYGYTVKSVPRVSKRST